MRKAVLFLATFVLASCKGSDIVDPPVTSSVEVTSTPTLIAVGETAQAIAVVKDQNGNSLSGKSITWTSLNQSIATVTSAGVIRGVSPGTATIQGSVDGITGSAAIQVVATSAVCASGPLTLDLAVGQVRVVSAVESQGCVKIASTSAASQYIVIAANFNALPDATGSFAMRTSDGETVPSNTLLASPFRVAASLSAPTGADDAMSLQNDFESTIRLTERRQLDLPKAQRAFAEGSLQRGPRYSVSAAAIPVVGEKTQFRIPKSCEDFKTITATVRHISTRAIMYIDDASPANGFSDVDLQGIASEFDNVIYPTNSDYFGTPLDLDVNARIVILYTPEVNKLTPAGNPSGFVGGFAFAGDLFPTSDCPQSNRAEVLYLLAPDPTGAVNGNVRSVSDVRQGTRGTIAHELQHIINASERIRHPVTEHLEAIWLDEALAHFAEDATGRSLRGLNETGNYTFEQLTNNGSQVNDFNAFFFQNFARMLRWIQNPGPNGPTSASVDTSLAVRGAAWGLLRYAADHHAPGGDVKGFVRSLVPGPDTGVVNLRSKAGGVSFDSLTAGFVAANYADDLGVANLAVKYGYKTYNMRNNIARINTPSQSFPFFVTEVTGTAQTGTGFIARSGSGHYFRMTRAAGAPAKIFRFVNADLSTAASYPGAAMVILRTQ